MKYIVVAYDQARGIGADNDLLWKRDLPTDLRHFRELTLGRSVVMGRNTYESIGRALPGRQNIVVTHRPLDTSGVDVAGSLEEAYMLASSPDIAIIGGAQIYEQALGDVDVVYATEVDAHFSQASVFFSALDSATWREATRDHHAADAANKYPFDFVTYHRREG